MDRTQKKELVASLHSAFEDISLMVVTQYKGLTVADMTNLRRRMRDVGASFKVTKNRLTRLALDGTDFTNIGHLFIGPTAIAYSKDPVAAAKVVVEFAKGNEKLVIVGGALGKLQLDAEGIKALATLPSLDELRARLIAMIQTPATRIAGVVQAPAGQLARVLQAYVDKQQGGTEEAA